MTSFGWSLREGERMVRESAVLSLRSARHIITQSPEIL